MALKIRLGKYDTLWSKLVRARDGRCLNCGKRPPYQLQAHHVMPRGRKATRFVLENGITLCAHCHTLGDHSVHRVGKKFVIDLLGLRQYKKLERMSLVTMSETRATLEFEDRIANDPTYHFNVQA